MKVLWLEQAQTDLRELISYLLDRAPEAAHRTYESILHQVGNLADQPALGRPGRIAETRELVVAHTPHIVAYTVDRKIEAVIVLRVLHGARRWPEHP